MPHAVSRPCSSMAKGWDTGSDADESAFHDIGLAQYLLNADSVLVQEHHLLATPSSGRSYSNHQVQSRQPSLPRPAKRKSQPPRNRRKGKRGTSPHSPYGHFPPRPRTTPQRESTRAVCDASSSEEATSTQARSGGLPHKRMYGWQPDDAPYYKCRGRQFYSRHNVADVPLRRAAATASTRQVINSKPAKGFSASYGSGNDADAEYEDHKMPIPSRPAGGSRTRPRAAGEFDGAKTMPHPPPPAALHIPSLISTLRQSQHEEQRLNSHLARTCGELSEVRREINRTKHDISRSEAALHKSSRKENQLMELQRAVRQEEARNRKLHALARNTSARYEAHKQEQTEYLERDVTACVETSIPVYTPRGQNRDLANTMSRSAQKKEQELASLQEVQGELRRSVQEQQYLQENGIAVRKPSDPEEKQQKKRTATHIQSVKTRTTIVAEKTAKLQAQNGEARERLAVTCDAIAAKRREKKKRPEASDDDEGDKNTAKTTEASASQPARSPSHKQRGGVGFLEAANQTRCVSFSTNIVTGTNTTTVETDPVDSVFLTES